MEKSKLTSGFQAVSRQARTLCGQAWNKVSTAGRRIGRGVAREIGNILLDDTTQDLLVYGGAVCFLVSANYRNNASFSSQLSYASGVLVLAAVARDRLRRTTNEIKETLKNTQNKREKPECTMS